MAKTDLEDFGTLPKNIVDISNTTTSVNTPKPESRRVALTSINPVKTVLQNPDFLGIMSIGIGLFLGRLFQSWWKKRPKKTDNNQD